jgi:outer membrane protein assembly factor BamB
LIKVDNTGNLLWRYDTQEDYATSIAIDKYGNLIFGSSTYGLHSVNNAGKLNWKLPITQDPKRRKNIHNAPVVDENSNIYVAVDSSELNEGATTIRKYSREGELIFKVQYPEKLYHKGGSLILGNNKLFCRTRSAKLLVIE